MGWRSAFVHCSFENGIECGQLFSGLSFGWEFLNSNSSASVEWQMIALKFAQTVRSLKDYCMSNFRTEDFFLELVKRETCIARLVNFGQNGAVTALTGQWLDWPDSPNPRQKCGILVSPCYFPMSSVFSCAYVPSSYWQPWLAQLFQRNSLCCSQIVSSAGFVARFSWPF